MITPKPDYRTDPPLTRRRAIRRFYLGLHCGSKASVRACSMTGHPLYPWRLGKVEKVSPLEGTRTPDVRTGADFRFDDALQPAKAIRAACLDCRPDGPGAVRKCPHYSCELWPYRFGRKARAAKQTPTRPN